MSGVVARGGDLSNVGLIVCDLDGVVYLGSEPIRGAAEALAAFARGGIELLFVTNNATRSRRTAAEAVRALVGYEARPEQMVTSSWATAAWIRGRVETALVVGEEGLIETLDEFGIRVVDSPDEVDAVVVGLDRRVDYDRIARAAQALHRGARLYATNTDATYPTPQGLAPGAGAIVAAVETAAGVTAEVCGKPHLPMRRLLDELTAGRTVAVIGDRVETDVALGVAQGWATILVLTGVTADADGVPGDLAPTAVVPSIADALSLFGLAQ